MRIITDKGEELSFPIIRWVGSWAIAWVGGVACGWGWFGEPSTLLAAQAFVIGTLLGALIMCLVIVVMAKK